MSEECYKNTDKELWRETPDDYYADRLFVTDTGGIGMNCDGYVVVKPIRQWHDLATRVEALTQERDQRDTEAGLYCAKWEDAKAALAQAEQERDRLQHTVEEQRATITYLEGLRHE